MIYYGKEFYLKDLWFFNIFDVEKMGYIEEEMNWVVENEVEVWCYFIENELLYSIDVKLF